MEVVVAAVAVAPALLLSVGLFGAFTLLVAEVVGRWDA
jgi:hypothetical protein